MSDANDQAVNVPTLSVPQRSLRETSSHQIDRLIDTVTGGARGRCWCRYPSHRADHIVELEPLRCRIATCLKCGGCALLWAVMEIGDPYAWGNVEHIGEALLGWDGRKHARAKACKVCGQGFIGHRARELCGRPACADFARLDYFRKRRKRLRGEPEPVKCEVCGQPVTIARATRRYCSPACRQAAYRGRRATRS